MANSNNQTKQELQLSSKNQLSTLEIVGIVIGIIVGIVGLTVAIYQCRNQHNPGSSPEQGRMIGGDNVGGDNYSGANFSGGVNIGNTNNNTRKWYWVNIIEKLMLSFTSYEYIPTLILKL